MREQQSRTIRSVSRGLLDLTRPWQWYKQGLMFIGIVFSRNLFVIDAWVDLLVGVAAFTAVAAAIYSLNDVVDREADRKHPEKQDRPIASGQVSPLVGTAFGVVLGGVGLAVSSMIGRTFLATIVSYVLLNALYSLYLKRVLFADVLTVAVGFVIRATAGVVVIDVVLSPWLIASTFLLALVLTLGKRREELSASSHPHESRSVLETYDQEALDQLLGVSMGTLLMAYSLYTFSNGDATMMATLPFSFFGVFRYQHLVYTTDIAQHPHRLLTDRQSVVNLVIWVTVSVAILYDLDRIALEVVT